MRLLNRLTISRKLTLFGVTTSVLVVALMAVSLALYDIRNIRVSLEESYSTMADVVGQSCAAAIETHNRDEATRVLKVLDEDEAIQSAQLLDHFGGLFVEYMSTASPQRNGRYRTVALPGESMSFERPIARNGIVIGHIRLDVSSDLFWSQSREHMLLILIVALSSVAMAAVLASYLQRMLSGPVLHLVSTARAVCKTGDYSRRAHRESHDELGELCDEFNEMLVQIEARDAELELHRKHLEALVRLRTEALEQKTREALAASVAKSQFLANMSHEIRTPMNAILGFADLLRRGADAGNAHVRAEYLDTISTSGKHLLSLINDILDLSKIEAGKMQVERISCSAHQIIAEAVSVLKVRANEKGLSLDFSWEGAVPKQILTDSARLRQLVINLIGNAIKFTERGRVQVVARLQPAGEQQHQLRIDVIDTGIGIPEDKLQVIFDPFAQADASVTRRFGGTGLGLSISRHIAEALGGSLSVQSELGKGSIFTILLDPGPIDAQQLLDAPPVATYASSSQSGEISALGLAPGRILLVEDGDTNRKLIRIILQRHALEVTEAVNGQEGVDLAMSQDFDLILMDMQMPVMDGYTAAGELRRRGSNIPIVALTAHAMAGDAERCIAAGCTDYLSKPIDETRLVIKLAQYLQGSVDTAMNEMNYARETTPMDEVAPLRSSLPGNDPDFHEIIIEFIDRARDQMARLQTAADERRWDEVASVAHWLKGSGGTAGFDAFTGPAGRLERMARDGDVDTVDDVLATVSSLVDRLDCPPLPSMA